MSNVDIISILTNISHSLGPVQKLVSGLAYVLGVLCIFTAISKLGKIAGHHGQSASHEKMFSPVMYLLFGGMLLYLPTAIETLSNTAFGVGNPLTYTPQPKPDVYYTIGLFIRTAGLIWFVRGCVLVVQASQPGTQHGLKGLTFIIGGILALNFDNTIAMFNYILQQIITWTLAFKSSQGY